MKVIFFGTPDYVLPIVEILNKYHTLVGVVTQPPKLVGRKQIKTYSPIDKWAHRRKSVRIIHNLSVAEMPEAELGIVASYGRIIPKDVINHFKYGILNIHPSLLPKYRGASPIQAQIIAGETETGVTIIKMDDLMDHGQIVSSLRDVITQEDTNESLRRRLFEKSAQFLIDLIPNYVTQKIKLKKQNDDEATVTKILGKDDGFVEKEKIFEASEAIKIDRLFRAMKPWPGIWTLVDGKRLLLLGLHLVDDKLVLDKVQLEGKKTVSFDQFTAGYPDIKF